MLRSLYTGIAGLRNHQLKMDITSHNIANVNTTGYKAQRITFKEGFSQMLKGATRPAGNASGTNPMQVGLGMAVGSIDNIMEQGAMQSTGQLTDLGIEGRAFFAFSNGIGRDVLRKKRRVSVKFGRIFGSSRQRLSFAGTYSRFERRNTGNGGSGLY